MQTLYFIFVWFNFVEIKIRTTSNVSMFIWKKHYIIFIGHVWCFSDIDENFVNYLVTKFVVYALVGRTRNRVLFICQKFFEFCPIIVGLYFRHQCFNSFQFTFGKFTIHCNWIKHDIEPWFELMFHSLIVNVFSRVNTLCFLNKSVNFWKLTFLVWRPSSNIDWLMFWYICKAIRFISFSFVITTFSIILRYISSEIKSFVTDSNNTFSLKKCFIVFDLPAIAVENKHVTCCHCCFTNLPYIVNFVPFRSVHRLTLWRLLNFTIHVLN